ncbi:MAG: twin-arginine translocase TatA/TatE family subunit [Hyphomonadaceae bacterium]|nr:twin-arginine translocase TatA/TatE family subunit [Hyphomonadaceae bacterium]
MHFPGLVPLIIVLVLAFLLFGRPGRLSNLMEDLGKGIRGFRKGLTDPDQPKAAEEPARQVTAEEPAKRETDRTGA